MREKANALYPFNYLMSWLADILSLQYTIDGEFDGADENGESLVRMNFEGTAFIVP